MGLRDPPDQPLHHSMQSYRIEYVEDIIEEFLAKAKDLEPNLGVGGRVQDRPNVVVRNRGEALAT